jgi:hypothetical protein
MTPLVFIPDEGVDPDEWEELDGLQALEPGQVN